MSLKKMMIVPAVAGVLAGGVLISDNAYAVGQCTAHSGALTEGSIAKGLTQVTGAAIGGAVGYGLTFWTSNPLVKTLGVGAGSVFGWEASKPIGAAIKNAIDKDELCVGNYCLQCDTDEGGSHHECENQTVVSNGVDTFRCYASSLWVETDKWKKIDLPVCSDSPVKKGYGKKGNYKVMIKDNLTNNGSVVEKMPGLLRFSQHACYWVEEIKDTSDKCMDDQGNRTITNGKIQEPYPCKGKKNDVKWSDASNIDKATKCAAVCGATSKGAWGIVITECDNGWTPDVKGTMYGYTKCVKGKGNGGNGGNGGNSCLNRKTANGIACCRAGAATTYVEATDTCTCVDTTKQWELISSAKGNEYGACKAKDGAPSTDPAVSCDTVCDVTVINNLKTSCAAKSMASLITEVEVQCKTENRSKCNGDMIQQYITTITNVVTECSTPVTPEVPSVDTSRINDAMAAIDKSIKNLDVSVWTTAEGNFNGARLASDSIAGVVLGTTGALITSSVVKKNQIESGFEDIVCIVGGQEVGSFGDEITVGIK